MFGCVAGGGWGRVISTFVARLRVQEVDHSVYVAHQPRFGLTNKSPLCAETLRQKNR